MPRTLPVVLAGAASLALPAVPTRSLADYALSSGAIAPSGDAS